MTYAEVQCFLTSSLSLMIFALPDTLNFGISTAPSEELCGDSRCPIAAGRIVEADVHMGVILDLIELVRHVVRHENEVELCGARV